MIGRATAHEVAAILRDELGPTKAEHLCLRLTRVKGSQSFTDSIAGVLALLRERPRK